MEADVSPTQEQDSTSGEIALFVSIGINPAENDDIIFVVFVCFLSSLLTDIM